MADERYVKTIYQQWCSSNDDIVGGYLLFAKIAVAVQSVAVEAMLSELKHYSWFHWPK